VEHEMRVRVSFHGAVRDVVGADEETVQLPTPADVRRLLERLGEKHGPALTDRVLRRDGTTWPSVAILLNGSNISLNRGLNTPLAEGDVVAIVPVIAGGR